MRYHENRSNPNEKGAGTMRAESCVIAMVMLLLTECYSPTNQRALKQYCLPNVPFYDRLRRLNSRYGSVFAFLFPLLCKLVAFVRVPFRTGCFWNKVKASIFTAWNEVDTRGPCLASLYAPSYRKIFLLSKTFPILASRLAEMVLRLSQNTSTLLARAAQPHPLHVRRGVSILVELLGHSFSS